MTESPEELLARLVASPDYPYPKGIVSEMIRRSGEMTSAMLAVLEDAVTYPEKYTGEDGLWKSLTFSAYLLAQRRETRAFKPLCATLNLTGETSDSLWGDMITEDMGNALCSVYDGDDAPLRAIMSNPEAYEFIRGAAVPRTYQCLLKHGKIRLEELKSYTAWLLEHGLERSPSHAWDGWVNLCAEHGFADLLPLMEKAYSEGLCDPGFARPEEIFELATSGGDAHWSRNTDLIDDVISQTHPR
ncbi:MAG: DUF1186 domain-containing protein [Terrimicrobiaceae bacterium]